MGYILKHVIEENTYTVGGPYPQGAEGWCFPVQINCTANHGKKTDHEGILKRYVEFSYSWRAGQETAAAL